MAECKLLMGGATPELSSERFTEYLYPQINKQQNNRPFKVLVEKTHTNNDLLCTRIVDTRKVCQSIDYVINFEEFPPQFTMFKYIMISAEKEF